MQICQQTNHISPFQACARGHVCFCLALFSQVSSKGPGARTCLHLFWTSILRFKKGSMCKDRLKYYFFCFVICARTCLKFTASRIRCESRQCDHQHHTTRRYADVIKSTMGTQSVKAFSDFPVVTFSRVWQSSSL